MEKIESAQVPALIEEFATSYLATEKGKAHAAAYSRMREQGRQNFQAAVEAADRGEDVTDFVLTKLLPHQDTPYTRETGAWTHIAFAIRRDLKKWFENSDWTRNDDWPLVATAILNFLRRVTTEPSSLPTECLAFSELPYSKGLQSAFLSPILNAIRPEDFLIINGKSAATIRRLFNADLSPKLAEYPAANAVATRVLAEVKPHLMSIAPPGALPCDLFDEFCHWYVAERSAADGDYVGVRRYWKIAPGKDGWNWDECLQAGYIAMGWSELGDLANIAYPEFEQRRDSYLVAHPEELVRKQGLEQLWKFTHIEEGSQIVANRGTSEVLGIGEVTGRYFFVPNTEHGHRLPVKWYDTTRRKVDQPGWRRTLIELDQDSFERISRRSGDTLADSPNAPSQPAFSVRAFEILGQLHDSPDRHTYESLKVEIEKEIVEPFQALIRSVGRLLSPTLRALVETEKRVFGKLRKNDYGVGGVWDFYWSAFYPHGSERKRNTQLYVVLDSDTLHFGFGFGDDSSDQQARFRKALQIHRGIAELQLASIFSDAGWRFGSRVDSKVGLEASSWRTWFDHSGVRIQAAMRRSREEVLKLPADELANEIALRFEQLSPLVTLAVSGTVEVTPPTVDGLAIPDALLQPIRSPEFTLQQCAAATSAAEADLNRWLGAIERKQQAIIYGPPGTGKTFLAEHLARHLVGGTDGFWEIVQFHPAYAYEDFIQGMRPRARPEGGLDYPIVEGRFLEFARRAASRTGPSILIIDEINRANLARVFGELMYLLEYRGREIALASGNRFSIPTNIRILGTMNTADRSIALVDHALRRRFAFIPLYPDYELLRKYHQGTAFDPSGLIDTLRSLNSQIGDRHYEVGTSYFLREDLHNEIADIWRMEIEPYLEEYFFDRQAKSDSFKWDQVASKIAK